MKQLQISKSILSNPFDEDEVTRIVTNKDAYDVVVDDDNDLVIHGHDCDNSQTHDYMLDDSSLIMVL